MNNLKHLNFNEIELIYNLTESLKLIYPKIKSVDVVSEKTQLEYIVQANRILKARKSIGESLSSVVTRTNKKSTYFKCIAALKYYLIWIGSSSAMTLSEKRCEDSLHNIKLVIKDVNELHSIINNGFVGTREKRKSKRTSLKGLPQNWMERLCNYNAN
jgi:hypothetical protein